MLIRAAYALGGLGSGFADNEEEFRLQASKGFAYSDQLIVDQVKARKSVAPPSWKAQANRSSYVRDRLGYYCSVLKLETCPCQNSYSRRYFSDMILNVINTYLFVSYLFNGQYYNTPFKHGFKSMLFVVDCYSCTRGRRVLRPKRKVLMKHGTQTSQQLRVLVLLPLRGG